MQTALIIFEYIFVSLFSVSVHFAFAGHVCRVWQLWKGCGRTVAGMRPVRTVLPSLLCEQQSKYFNPTSLFYNLVFAEKRTLISTFSADHEDEAS